MHTPMETSLKFKIASVTYHYIVNHAHYNAMIQRDAQRASYYEPAQAYNTGLHGLNPNQPLCGL